MSKYVPRQQNDKLVAAAVEAYGPAAKDWSCLDQVLASKLAAMGIVPISYFLWLMSTLPRECTYVNVICSERQMALFVAGSEERNLTAKHCMWSDYSKYKTRIELGFTPREILEDDYLGLSALFRYAMASKFLLYDTMMKTKHAACEQLKFNPAYFTALSKELIDLFPLRKEEISL